MRAHSLSSIVVLGLDWPPVTMGNVQGSRPSMFDPLKRSKWSVPWPVG